MLPINMIMIYYWDKKLKKRMHVLEANLVAIPTQWVGRPLIIHLSSEDSIISSYTWPSGYCYN